LIVAAPGRRDAAVPFDGHFWGLWSGVKYGD
jgi:hypothetical protein